MSVLLHCPPCLHWPPPVRTLFDCHLWVCWCSNEGKSSEKICSEKEFCSLCYSHYLVSVRADCLGMVLLYKPHVPLQLIIVIIVPICWLCSIGMEINFCLKSLISISAAFWHWCLHRAAQTGKEYMMKQELIDAAEASGLSHMPIE